MITTDRYSLDLHRARLYDILPSVKLNQSIVFKCQKKSINGKISSIGKDMVEVIANGKIYLVGKIKGTWEGKLI